MPDLASLIEEILRQQLSDEARLVDLEAQTANIRGSIATAKEEIAHLLPALEIAIKRGRAQPMDLEAIKARLSRGPQECLPAEDINKPQPPGLVLYADESLAGDEDEEGEDEEEDTEEEVELAPTPASASRSTKLIDLVFDIIQGFAVEEEFTTADIRRELAKQYPGKFARINPASVSGTVGRLFKDYDAVERVGEYTDGIHYRRKVKPEPKEETPTIANTNPS